MVRLAALAVILVTLLTGCAAPVQETAKTTSPAAFPMQVTDQLGRTVTINKIPERIISLAPSNTEVLFALGLGDKVAGVSDYSDYPQEARTKPSVGAYDKPNIEQVVALNPDLILATDAHQAEVIPALQKLGLTVVALEPHNIEGVLESITLVGKVTGTQQKAGELVASLESRISAVTALTSGLTAEKRPVVFYIVWSNPLMSSGNGTFQADLIEKAGGTNVAANLNGWATISLESVVKANPAVILAGDMAAQGVNYQFIKNEPRLASTDAIRNGVLFSVNSDVTSRPGPRIVDALEEFAKFIHPELFK
jgi:iron complex transport system substrate-binding protein